MLINIFIFSLLQIISLICNQITDIIQNKFNHLPKLNKIILIYNFIDSNNDYFLKHIKKLTNIKRVHNIISNYQNLEKLYKLYSGENQFYNLYKNNQNYDLKYMARRIQNLLDLMFLKYYDQDSQKKLEDIMYLSVYELECLKHIKMIEKSKKIPLDIINIINKYL